MDLDGLEYSYQKSVVGADRATVRDGQHVVQITVPAGETLVGWAVLPPAVAEVSGCRFEAAIREHGRGVQGDGTPPLRVFNPAPPPNRLVREAVPGPSKATLRFWYEPTHLSEQSKKIMLDAWTYPPCGCCCERRVICADELVREKQEIKRVRSNRPYPSGT
jgi:hypothetical protein